MKVKLNNAILQSVSEIKECYKSSKAVNKDCFSVITKPFKVIKLNQVITDTAYISRLKDAALSVPLLDKNNDLYSLKQSESLLHASNDVIKDFVRFLQKSAQPWLEEILDYKFNDTISITSSLYQSGDVLLCHDDKCEDRCVAFVYYLTSVGVNNGGSFDMFDHDESGQPNKIVNSIPPEFNSFICFEVGNFTYHQVSEMTSDSDRRLSINGWFHCEKALSNVPLNYKEPLAQLQHQILLEGLIMLDEFMNVVHFTPTYMDQVKETFSDESHILLSAFFTKSFFSLCENSLKSSNIKWNTLGPANRRKYEVADMKSLKGPANTLVNFIKSSLFISYLKSITGLSLEPFSADKNSSKLIVELQKWTSGCYTMATDNDSFFNHDGLDIYIFFHVNNDVMNYELTCGGSTTYLDATGDQADPDNELLTIEPVDNGFCAVYRTSDTVKFTKYISHRFKGTYYCLAATYYEVDHKFS